MQNFTFAIHQHRAEHEVARCTDCHAAWAGQAARNNPAECGQAIKTRRLKSQHLVFCRECRANFTQGRASTRGDDQFGRVVVDDAAVGACVEHVARRSLAVPVFGAAAFDAQRGVAGAGVGDAVFEFLQLLFHYFFIFKSAADRQTSASHV